MEEKSGLLCLADIPFHETEWLADGYIPKGQITLLLGKRGIGKTELWCRLAAAASRGKSSQLDLIKVTDRTPGKVLYLSNNELADRDIIPILKESNADLSKIYTFDVQNVNFEKLRMEKGDSIIRLIDEVKPALLIFEPYQYFIDPGIKNYLIWTRMKPFFDTIKKHNTATIFVSKYREDPESIYRELSDSFNPDMWDLAGSVLLLEEENGKTKVIRKKTLH